MPHLRIPAIRSTQNGRHIYTGVVDGKLLTRFAAVSRIKLDDQDQLTGYQRPQVIRHIRGIELYLRTATAMLPNAVVLAVDERVTFTPVMLGQQLAVDDTVMGELVVPIDPAMPEHERPVWIVDGQQRASALRDADLAYFPISVVAFHAADEAEQREQFVLVNNQQALPPGLINELLPDTAARMPDKLERRKAATKIMAVLRRDPASPFHGAIRTPTNGAGRVKDTSVLKMITNSLHNGALYQYRDRTTGTVDATAAATHLNIFWSAVATTWPDAWALQPRYSRLTHGAGIVALGYVMDHLTEDTEPADLDTDHLHATLCGITPAWTGGAWLIDGQPRRWDDIQNLDRDIRALTHHLINQLPRRGRGAPSA